MKAQWFGESMLPEAGQNYCVEDTRRDSSSQSRPSHFDFGLPIPVQGGLSCCIGPLLFLSLG
jgi:hypothetical protein